MSGINAPESLPASLAVTDSITVAGTNTLNGTSLTNTGAQTITATGAALTLAATGANVINLKTNGSIRWDVSGAGHLLAGADNTYDIGAVGPGGPRPRTVYAGTSFIAGNSVTITTNSVDCSSALGVTSTGALDIGAGAGTTAITIGGGAAFASLTLGKAGYVTRILGDLQVDGATVSAGSENLLVADNHINMNFGYTSAIAQPGGIVITYLPTATTDTVAATGFTAGVLGVSNPTVKTTGNATFAAGDLVQISSANTSDNDGIFEVLTHVGTTLTVRGIGTTSTVLDFTQNQFTTDAVVAGALTKVNVSYLHSNTSGNWEVAKGSTNSSFPFYSVFNSGATSTISDSLGAIPHLQGPTDQDLLLASQNNKSIVISPNGSGVLELRNGITGQTLRAYNTYTSATNFERTDLYWSSNVAKLETSKGSGGGTARALALGTDATTRWSIGATDGHLTAGVDNNYDIGANGATRPRTIYAGTSVVAPTLSLSATTNQLVLHSASNPTTISAASTGTRTITLPDFSGNFVVTGGASSGQYASAAYALTAAGTVAIDWNNGNCQTLLLDNGVGNSALTFSNPKAGGRYLLRITQPASSGPRLISSWPTIKWAGGVTPTLTTTNSKSDIITLFYDGTDYFGTAALNF